MIRDQCFSPDEYTFSALARGCENREDAQQLFNEMNVSRRSEIKKSSIFLGRLKELNLKPNQKILEAMLKLALTRNNFPLLALICESFQNYNLSVNETFLHRIEKYLQETRNKILAMVGQFETCFSRFYEFSSFSRKNFKPIPKIIVC